MKVILNDTSFKVRRQKFGLAALILMLLGGMVSSAISVYLAYHSHISTDWVKQTGQVIDASSRASNGAITYAPVVKYMVAGQEYRVVSGINSSFRPQLGDTREVVYDPYDPEQAKVVEEPGFNFLMFIFAAAGLCLLILAPILFIRSVRRARKIKGLVQTGRKVTGVVADIQWDPFRRKNAYTIVVSATDAAGVAQNYVSDRLSSVGALATADYHHHYVPIDVYIDPGDPQMYYVDATDVPNWTAERVAELMKPAADKQIAPLR